MMDEHDAEMDSSIAVIRRLQDGLRELREENKRLLKLIARHELRIECLEAEMNTDILLFAMRNYEAALAELEGQGE